MFPRHGETCAETHLALVTAHTIPNRAETALSPPGQMQAVVKIGKIYIWRVLSELQNFCDETYAK